MKHLGNIIVVRLYLVLTICFLIPICFLVSVELLNLFRRNILFNRRVEFIQSIQINKEQILALAKVYINKQKWLTCILMLEFYISLNSINNANYYNCIGFCYQKILLNKIAKYYYINAMLLSPDSLSILKNVANIYKICGDTDNASKVYDKILQINKINNIKE
uniref:Uncharacterized protein n=1 Tax=Inkyuleea mariana TaxID=123988 RepID=A0A4D6X251_9FLOR|nr:hypothetical protein [Inkyuleea mariana]